VEIERLAQHTAAEIAKIQAHAEQEIASAGKAARTELKRYSAQLAVELAEQKIRARMTPQTQDALVRGFVRDLK
jgi:F0F1-type ATP synthase membrane subunit b/b'